LHQPELPLKGNYDPKLYKIYYKDTGLLIASLDEEAQEDLRANKNLGTYKGAVYENIAGDMLVKQGYNLFYYRNDKATLEMDFFIRDAESLIPVEVKSNDNATASLNNLLKKEKYPDVKYGIKLGYKNIAFNRRFYTFPYFLAFLLKRFLNSNHVI
jgi:predicted AAA+ superfamily ATPase